MDHWTLSLAVGAVAGALEVIPMIFQRTAFTTCISSFLIYLFAGVLIFHSNLPWWADGMAVTLMLTVPLLFVLTGKDRKNIPLALFNALLFGFLISAAEHYL